MPLYNLFSASEVKLYAVVQKKKKKQKQQLVNEHDVFIVML